MNDKSWYAIRTATRRETSVEDGLKELKLDFYQPKLTMWRRLRRKKEKAHRALFPGYLFVLCSVDDFHRIHAIDGFHQFVRVLTATGQLRPMVFPDEAIGDLMMRQEFGEFDQTKSQPERYRPKTGDTVIVTGGKWYSYIAEVLSLSPSKRQAKLKIDGMQTTPMVSYSCLDIASAEEAA